MIDLAVNIYLSYCYLIRSVPVVCKVKCPASVQPGQREEKVIQIKDGLLLIEAFSPELSICEVTL
jgi:hypothetical protein